ncbi:uncharacterized protein LOC109609332 [Aethina tumida]|uniref:uncharacterized protein LOC109609332 n=1 Tax=Aethina tumida TaxID=116153 RepID=UPI0021482B2C|nr:uncharacterized protein LOC109609332 [Aethina tumida]
MKCMICDQAFTNDSDVSVIQCGHVFDSPCISQSLEITGTCPRCGETCSSESMHKLFGITFEYTDRTSDFRKQRDALNDNFCRKFYEIMCLKEEYSDTVKKSDELKNQVEEIKQRNETVTANVDNLKVTEASLKRTNSRLRKSVWNRCRNYYKLHRLINAQLIGICANKLKKYEAGIMRLEKSYDDAKQLKQYEKRSLENKLNEYKRRLDLHQTSGSLEDDHASESVIGQGVETNNSSISNSCNKLENKLEEHKSQLAAHETLDSPENDHASKAVTGQGLKRNNSSISDSSDELVHKKNKMDQTPESINIISAMLSGDG